MYMYAVRSEKNSGGENEWASKRIPLVHGKHMHTVKIFTQLIGYTATYNLFGGFFFPTKPPIQHQPKSELPRIRDIVAPCIGVCTMLERLEVGHVLERVR